MMILKHERLHVIYTQEELSINSGDIIFVD